MPLRGSAWEGGRWSRCATLSAKPFEARVPGAAACCVHFQVQLMQLTEKQAVCAAHKAGAPIPPALPTGLTAVCSHRAPCSPSSPWVWQETQGWVGRRPVSPGGVAAGSLCHRPAGGSPPRMTLRCDAGSFLRSLQAWPW